MTTAIVPAESTMPSNGGKTYKRFGLGALIGGALGAVVAGPPGAAAGVVLGGGLGALTGKKPGASFGGTSPGDAKGGLTATRVKLYRDAMESMRDPSELRALADAYEQEGFQPFAIMLRKRADAREMTAEEKRQRQDAFRAAMSSDDPGKILTLAVDFEGEGSTKAADALRSHAAAVRAARLAGAQARPVADGRIIADLGERLRKAIIHFGSESIQAQTAAATLLRAGGVNPDQTRVLEAVAAAKADIEAQAPVPPPQAPAREAAPAMGEDEGPIKEMHGTQESTVTPVDPPAGEGGAAS